MTVKICDYKSHRDIPTSPVPLRLVRQWTRRRREQRPLRFSDPAASHVRRAARAEDAQVDVGQLIAVQAHAADMEPFLAGFTGGCCQFLEMESCVKTGRGVRLTRESSGLHRILSHGRRSEYCHH